MNRIKEEAVLVYYYNLLNQGKNRPEAIDHASHYFGLQVSQIVEIVAAP